MEFTKENATQRLIEAHKKGRAHLQRLLEGIDEEMWFELPGEGRWSIQRAATHIINAEISWMVEKSKAEPDYLGRESTMDEFHKKSSEVAERLYEKLESEDDFEWTHPKDGVPSYHWTAIRCMKHAVYHTGMISLLRQQVGAPDLEGEDSWPDMVDSIFEIAIQKSDS